LYLKWQRDLSTRFTSPHQGASAERNRAGGTLSALALGPPGGPVKLRDGEQVRGWIEYFDDSMIGSASGYPIAPEFLRDMHDKYF
jgi:hypothetical protein